MSPIYGYLQPIRPLEGGAEHRSCCHRRRASKPSESSPHRKFLGNQRCRRVVPLTVAQQVAPELYKSRTVNVALVRVEFCPAKNYTVSTRCLFIYPPLDVPSFSCPPALGQHGIGNYVDRAHGRHCSAHIRRNPKRNHGQLLFLPQQLVQAR